MGIPISNEVVGVFSKFADQNLLFHKHLDQIFMIACCDRFDTCAESKPKRALTVGRALLENRDERIARNFVDEFLNVIRTLGFLLVLRRKRMWMRSVLHSVFLGGS